MLCDSRVLLVGRRTRDKEDENVEKHLAAIQIQEMFRRRLAVKEGKGATRLPRPFVQQVFRGHRNSRTMVIFAAHFVTAVFMLSEATDDCAANLCDFILFCNVIQHSFVNASRLYCLD